MILAPNFGLSEMTRSNTAARLHIDNSLNPNSEADQRIIANLKALCLSDLQPIRDRFGPIRVNSGYRCPELNARLPGAPRSEHLCEGFKAAADICSLGAHKLDAEFRSDRPVYTALELFEWIIMHDLPYRTIILERRQRQDESISEWVHIGHSRVQEPRRKIMIIDKIIGIKEVFMKEDIIPALDKYYRS